MREEHMSSDPEVQQDDDQDDGGWPDSEDGSFKSADAWVTFFIRLPFPFPLLPDRAHRFIWHGASYADPSNEIRMGTPPCVDARFVHVTMAPDEAPPVLRPGFFEGLALVLGDDDEENDSVSANVPSTQDKDRPMIQTWAILTTPAVLVEGEDSSHLRTACFERVIRELNHLIRAFSFIIDDPMVHPVNKEELDFLIVYEFRDVATGDPWGRGLFPLHANIPRGLPLPTEEQELQMYAVVFQQAHGHPFTKYREWLNRAKHSRYQRGDYEEAVIRLQTSVESLFFGLVYAIGVDAHLSAVEIDDRLARIESFSSLVKSILPAKLGGNWNVDAPTLPIGRYWQDLYLARNLVTHAGRHIDYYDMSRAFEAFDGLMEFVVERLLAQPRTFPRTILAFLGEPGLKRRGAWTKFFQSFSKKVVAEGPPFWWPDDLADREPSDQ
jgi:hypothetical protein